MTPEQHALQIRDLVRRLKQARQDAIKAGLNVEFTNLCPSADDYPEKVDIEGLFAVISLTQTF